MAFLVGLVALAVLAWPPRAIDRGVLAAALAALVVRLLVAPAFVHDGFHGPLIVNGVLAFPSPPGRGSYGTAYGPGSFVVLGLLSFLTGRSAEGVMLANVLVSSLATLPLAAAASRLSGRPRAGLYAAILWAGSPLVARLARSEDAHLVGLVFAMAGLAWICDERKLWAGVL